MTTNQKNYLDLVKQLTCYSTRVEYQETCYGHFTNRTTYVHINRWKQWYYLPAWDNRNLFKVI